MEFVGCGCIDKFGRVLTHLARECQLEGDVLERLVTATGMAGPRVLAPSCLYSTTWFDR